VTTRPDPCAWRIRNHAAIGVWYSPRQCRCHRYEWKLAGERPTSKHGSGVSPSRPANPSACSRCPPGPSARSPRRGDSRVPSELHATGAEIQVRRKGYNLGSTGSLSIARRPMMHSCARYNGSLSVNDGDRRTGVTPAEGVFFPKISCRAVRTFRGLFENVIRDP